MCGLGVVPTALRFVRDAVETLPGAQATQIAGAEDSVLMVPYQGHPRRRGVQRFGAHVAARRFGGVRVVGECFHHALVGPPVDDVLMCGHCFDWLERKSLTSRMLKRASPFLPR